MENSNDVGAKEEVLVDTAKLNEVKTFLTTCQKDFSEIQKTVDLLSGDYKEKLQKNHNEILFLGIFLTEQQEKAKLENIDLLLVEKRIKDNADISFNPKEPAGFFKGFWNWSGKGHKTYTEDKKEMLVDTIVGIHKKIKTKQAEKDVIISDFLKFIITEKKDFLFAGLYCKTKAIIERGWSLCYSLEDIKNTHELFSGSNTDSLRKEIDELEKEVVNVSNEIIVKKKATEDIAEEIRLATSIKSFSEVVQKKEKLDQEILDAINLTSNKKIEVNEKEKYLSELLERKEKYKINVEEVDGLLVECEKFLRNFESWVDSCFVLSDDLFLKTVCSYISKTFSSEAGLLKKWLKNGKKALIINYFLFFECHNEGSTSPLNKIPSSDFNFTVIKYVPTNFGIFNYHSSITYRDEIDSKKCSTEEYFFRKNKEKEEFSFLETSSWFEFKYDNSLCFKSGPIWKEWTMEDEEILKRYSSMLFCRTYSEFYKCCSATVKAKVTIL